MRLYRAWFSRCVRFVIADHSPERILGIGLLMRAAEKNPATRAQRWEYHVENFLGMVRLGCMQILLKYL